MNAILAWLSHNLVPILATGLGGYFAHRYSSPTDTERAALLEQIADGAAALVVSLNPGKPWAELIADVAARVSAAAGVPTRSQTAVNQAAARALQKLGKGAGA